nr:MAG TPA: Metal binding domain of Ada [Bacteriophage sp.]
MNYTKRINCYGSELWSFNAAGVSYKNDDGTNRQEIIDRLHCGAEYNCHLERYVYQGESAYHIVINDQTVGNVPKNIAKTFGVKDDAGYWPVIVSAGIHGGPDVGCEFEDDEPWYYGIHLKVKLVSPTEQKIRQLSIDGEWSAYEELSVGFAPDEDAQPDISEETNAIDSNAAHRAQNIRQRPGWIKALAIVCFACILAGAISNLLGRLPHVSKEPSGTRLNENNAAEYAPDIELPQAENIEYTIDVHEKVFHIAGCSLVNQIKDTDRMLATVSRDEIIAKGYTPCEECHP